MTTINTGVAELLAVRVPEGFWAAHVNEYGDIEAYPEDGGGGTKPIAWRKYKSDLPPGNWLPLGLGSELTEEQWQPLVEKIHVEEMPHASNDMAGGWHYAYVDYQNRGDYAGWQGDAGCYRKATASGHSLCRSYGIEPNEAVILLNDKK